MPGLVLAAVPDLMMQSRIAAAVQRAGLRFAAADGPQDLVARARAEPPELVLLDLESPRALAEECLRALAAEPALAAVPTLGFYGHVHVALAQRMLAAGLREAVARGELERALAARLAERLAER